MEIAAFPKYEGVGLEPLLPPYDLAVCKCGSVTKVFRNYKKRCTLHCISSIGIAWDDFLHWRLPALYSLHMCLIWKFTSNFA